MWYVQKITQNPIQFAKIYWTCVLNFLYKVQNLAPYLPRVEASNPGYIFYLNFLQKQVTKFCAQVYDGLR